MIVQWKGNFFSSWFPSIQVTRCFTSVSSIKYSLFSIFFLLSTRFPLLSCSTFLPRFDPNRMFFPPYHLHPRNILPVTKFDLLVMDFVSFYIFLFSFAPGDDNERRFFLRCFYFFRFWSSEVYWIIKDTQPSMKWLRKFNFTVRMANSGRHKIEAHKCCVYIPHSTPKLVPDFSHFFLPHHLISHECRKSINLYVVIVDGSSRTWTFTWMHEHERTKKGKSKINNIKYVSGHPTWFNT